MISLLLSRLKTGKRAAIKYAAMAFIFAVIMVLYLRNIVSFTVLHVMKQLPRIPILLREWHYFVQQKIGRIEQYCRNVYTRQKQLCQFAKTDKAYVQRAGIVSFSFMLVLLSGMFHLIEPLSAHSQRHTENAYEALDMKAEMLGQIETAAGNNFAIFDDASPEKNNDEILELETILVPKRNTVISSSRDGKIKAIHVHNGDLFQKGDTLIQYDCRDVEAEIIAKRSEASLSRKKALRSAKLFKLEIISDVENIELDTEQKKAEANFRALEQRLDSCSITAEYNGRVTNRLANPGEYTRTDRVLMEVASLDDLNAEFLMPSIWLRWVNIGAPVTIMLHETGEEYEAEIIRFYGEVDPASQSIQVTARLKSYDVPLLPGMSGVVQMNKDQITAMDMSGYLQNKRAR